MAGRRRIGRRCLKRNLASSGVSLAGQLLTSWGLDGVRGLLVARRRGQGRGRLGRWGSRRGRVASARVVSRGGPLAPSAAWTSSPLLLGCGPGVAGAARLRCRRRRGWVQFARTHPRDRRGMCAEFGCFVESEDLEDAVGDGWGLVTIRRRPPWCRARAAKCARRCTREIGVVLLSASGRTVLGIHYVDSDAAPRR
jgi:hypothetical protein